MESTGDDPKQFVARVVAQGFARLHARVLEARRLAMWALHTEQPERFIWIDESGIVARVGSRPA